MKHTQILKLFFIHGFLVSCGVAKENLQKSSLQSSQDLTQENPKASGSVSLSDVVDSSSGDCPQKKPSVYQGKVKIFNPAVSGIHRFVDATSKIFSGPQLASSHIDAVFEGLSYNSDPVKILKKASVVSLCEGSQELSSTQQAALSSLENLEKSYDFFESLSTTADLALGKAKLFVFSKKLEKNQISQKDTWIQDNVSFVHNHFLGSSFEIYPRSSQALKNGLWQNMNLWESLWVMGHEFGHLVFFKTAKPNSNPQADARKIKVLNEAFADLYADALTRHNKTYLGNVDCLEMSRDLNSAFFGNRQFKTLGHEMLSRYLTQNFSTVGPTPCNAPSVRNAHSVGAVLARALRIAGAQASSPQEFAERLLNWGTELAPILAKPTFEISEALQAGVLSMNGGKKLETRACFFVQQVLGSEISLNCTL